MSFEPFTFYNYLAKSSTPNSRAFKMHFKEQMERLPDKIVSSKQLMKILDIKSTLDFEIFHKAFLEYFKVKCQNG